MEYTVALTSEDLHMLSQLQDLLPPFRCSFEMCPCFPVLFLLFVTLLAQNMKHQQDADASGVVYQDVVTDIHISKVFMGFSF